MAPLAHGQWGTLQGAGARGDRLAVKLTHRWASSCRGQCHLWGLIVFKWIQSFSTAGHPLWRSYSAYVAPNLRTWQTIADQNRP